MKDIALEVKNLCVDYRVLGTYSIKSFFLQILKKKRNDITHALNNICFSLETGEILGIIGKNGCGKSTLLNTIGGIFSPDSGSVDLHGHSVSLLSIGVGFNKDISGRDNVVLSGMLLGFDKKYILSKMDEIIAFSELGDFIDKPVRTYSKGMHSKLAFSVSAILEPEIMLIDEVLSVGDEHFKKKSMKKMKSLIKNTDRTVIIVSHNTQTLERLCTKVMWMHDGEIVKIGETKKVLKEYLSFMNKSTEG